MAKTCIIYDRSNSKGKDRASPCVQRVDRCKAAVSAIGGDIVGVFEDVGVSGSEGAKAPARDQLMQRIKAGDIDYVVVPDLARLSRSVVTIMNVTSEMKASGAELLIAHDLVRE
nr:recombinase family protein [uncultured Brevundimonas sp.]